MKKNMMFRTEKLAGVVFVAVAVFLMLPGLRFCWQKGRSRPNTRSHPRLPISWHPIWSCLINGGNSREDVSQRYIRSAEAALNSGVHESAMFQTYHAFESIGGALAASRGRHYPRAHAGKINVFTNLSHGRTYGLAVAQLAIQLSSLMNRGLYHKHPC